MLSTRMAPPPFDALIAGAGLSGAACARVLAEGGWRVLVRDQRDHLAGLAFDHRDEQGLTVHRYGPHLLHTADAAVWTFLSRFTAWTPYRHRVLARHAGRLFPLPINRDTLEAVFGQALPTEADAAALLAREREPRDPPATAEDVVIGSVGRRLFEAFFRHYTRKQWGCEARDLGPEVTRRVPVRLDRDPHYFNDPFQAQPSAGFTALVGRLLDHPGIRVELATPVDSGRDRCLARHLVWTGHLDACFGHRLGRLPWRCLRFEHLHLAQDGLALPAPVVNECDAEPAFTRTTEFRWMTGETGPGTSLVREWPGDVGEAAYPVPGPASRDLAQRYRDLAVADPGLHLTGRLGTYRYLNMDQAVGEALALADRLLKTP